MSPTSPPETLQQQFAKRIEAVNLTNTDQVTQLVDAILAGARDAAASDVHLLPAEDSMQMLWRIDGVLHSITQLPCELASNIVARLKVLADLLTYRTDVPQEGRIHNVGFDVEQRVSTFPTLYGEKAVVRLFVGSGNYRYLDDLRLPEEIATNLRHLLLQRGGIIMVTGPAGSGKTTSIYACLREIVDKFEDEKSLVSLEDPIEAVISGVAQSQINATAGFGYETGLKSLMRQDPEVIMVGEIRDRTTAEIVFQASLTGHLVLTTFHAGSAAGAISRLSDMGVEPYLLRSGILGVICQRLVRRLCECANPVDGLEARLGLDVESVHEPNGCDRCGGTGYSGRMVLAEMLLPDLKDMGRAILSKSDAMDIEELAVKSGMISRWQRAADAINSGLTSPAEIRRVLGFE